MGSEKKMDADDSKWVEAINHGDSSAFEQLFAKYYSRLSRFAYRYVQSETVAKSLTQEVFVKVWKQRDQLDMNENL